MPHNLVIIHFFFLLIFWSTFDLRFPYKAIAFTYICLYLVCVSLDIEVAIDCALQLLAYA